MKVSIKSWTDGIMGTPKGPDMESENFDAEVTNINGIMIKASTCTPFRNGEIADAMNRKLELEMTSDDLERIFNFCLENNILKFSISAK